MERKESVITHQFTFITHGSWIRLSFFRKRAYGGGLCLSVSVGVFSCHSSMTLKWDTILEWSIPALQRSAGLSNTQGHI